ncbi:MAG: homoserine dehydrogenase [Dehalococcoidia bacterium]|nr:homoserine dehydrogenase [Dehalococcoidia bacterium]
MDRGARARPFACGGRRGAMSEASEPMEPIGVSLLGAGNVGAGVLAALQRGAERYAARVGRPLELRRVLVRARARPRAGAPAGALTDRFEDVLEDERTQIVVELMGGEHPAREYIARALASGRHVVTANKEVMAKCGPELLELASEHGVRLLYEASVGGGIPIVRPLGRDLLANEITAVTAIINGTTNYVLTAMTYEGSDYAEALAEAQRLGYAEPDPTDDVEGIDAAYKLAILCGLAFHVTVSPDDIARQGISGLSARDFRYADELGYTIKLLASGRLVDGALDVSVRPTLIAYEEPLGKVDGVLNAVQVEGDLVGRVLFEGPGAGPKPTASAVLADVLDVARDVVAGRGPLEAIRYRKAVVRPPSEQESRYYMRVTVADRAGVLAKIAGALGDNDISIASVVQFEVDEDARTAELVITTHKARGGRLDAALATIRELDEVVEIGSVLQMAG